MNFSLRRQNRGQGREAMFRLHVHHWSASGVRGSTCRKPYLPCGWEAKPAHYIDFTANFSRFVDETAGMDEAARVAQFRTQMSALLPGFCTPRNGTTPARYGARVARALMEFPAPRPRYEQAQWEFPAAFEAGIQHFRKALPCFTPNMPVYLLHSLGEMDGGIRELGGRHLCRQGHESLNALLTGGPEPGEFPRRFGYYAALRVAKELGEEYSLAELAHMPPIRVQTAQGQRVQVFMRRWPAGIARHQRCPGPPA